MEAAGKQWSSSKAMEQKILDTGVNHAFPSRPYNPYDTNYTRTLCGEKIDDLPLGDGMSSGHVVTCLACAIITSRTKRTRT